MPPTAVSVNLRSVEDCDSLLGGVAEWPVTVADLPANACGDFFAWWEAVVTPETLAALNLELFGVGVIAPEARSVASVIEWAARLQDSMKFIIALNHCGSQRVSRERKKVFVECFSSSVGRHFRETLRPSEVEIPPLYAGFMPALARARALPSFEAEDRSVPLLDRSRIKAWAGAVHHQRGEIL